MSMETSEHSCFPTRGPRFPRRRFAFKMSFDSTGVSSLSSSSIWFPSESNVDVSSSSIWAPRATLADAGSLQPSPDAMEGVISTRQTQSAARVVPTRTSSSDLISTTPATLPGQWQADSKPECQDPHRPPVLTEPNPNQAQFASISLWNAQRRNNPHLPPLVSHLNPLRSLQQMRSSWKFIRKPTESRTMPEWNFRKLLPSPTLRNRAWCDAAGQRLALEAFLVGKLRHPGCKICGKDTLLKRLLLVRHWASIADVVSDSAILRTYENDFEMVDATQDNYDEDWSMVDTEGGLMDDVPFTVTHPRMATESFPSGSDYTAEHQLNIGSMALLAPGLDVSTRKSPLRPF
ncbi:hypothetical protein MSAN_00217600 [Mycena sanguinolenta]|uniref:Uncharacterized protein n=1 Tax=Mycena sanguinolenta TaxID=230812 RepID=A0A8H7DLJ2_9AGAR|nr:hypothetical protein MSAN_00217600 [Mycena sanguinolenta]